MAIEIEFSSRIGPTLVRGDTLFRDNNNNRDG